MRFALLGAAGYVAPRHMQAIHETGHELVAVMDPHDAVGKLDSYFPQCAYFSEFERFDRFVEKERRNGQPIEWLSICSPSYLHEPHVRWGLRMGMDVICEKPLVLNPKNLDTLAEIEEETGQQVFTMLQLRQSAEMIALKEKGAGGFGGSVFYHAPRGVWYRYSWKGDESKSGGLLSNIGVHYFDLAIWLFGPVAEVKVTRAEPDLWEGAFFHSGNVFHWSVSTRGPYRRSLTIGGEEIQFANFAKSNLHTDAYAAILAGDGTGLDEARKCHELIGRIKEVGAR